MSPRRGRDRRRGGWLLRQISPDQHTQEFLDITTALRLKEQMLEKVQNELKVQAAGMKIFESKILEAEELNQSTSQELSARNDRLKALQEELAVRTQRLMVLEAEEAAVQRRVSEYDAAAAAQSKEIQQLHLKCKETQQTLESNEEERCDLQRRIAELESTVAEADRLRARVEELEPAQGRVHWLEVQLCDRDGEYRAALHQLNSQLAERDRRIGELEPLPQQLQKQEAALKQWERNMPIPSRNMKRRSASYNNSSLRRTNSEPNFCSMNNSCTSEPNRSTAYSTAFKNSKRNSKTWRIR